MKGWKTWLAAAIIGGVAAGKFLGVDPNILDAVLYMAAALGLVGLGHKLEKNGG